MADTQTNHPVQRETEDCREAGQALPEYAMVLALVSLTAVGLTPVGQWVAARLQELSAAF